MRPKFAYFRSEKHRRTVAALDCQHCGAAGPSQAAHSNLAAHGKGRAIKASDEYLAALCPRCHTMVDESYTLTQEQRNAIWAQAYLSTRKALHIAGQWPAELE